MQGRYLPAIVTLVAGLVASIICLVKKISIIKSLTIVLIVLIIFLILGLIARKVIVYTLSERIVDSEKDGSETEENENLEHENEEQVSE